MNRRHIFLGAFVIFVGIHTYWELRNCHDLPWPPHFIGAGIALGLLDLFSFVNEDLASVMAIGLVLASVVQKGFTGDCSHKCTGTSAPTSYALIPNAGQTSGPQTI